MGQRFLLRYSTVREKTLLVVRQYEVIWWTDPSRCFTGGVNRLRRTSRRNRIRADSQSICLLGSLLARTKCIWKWIQQFTFSCLFRERKRMRMNVNDGNIFSHMPPSLTETVCSRESTLSNMSRMKYSMSDVTHESRRCWTKSICKCVHAQAKLRKRSLSCRLRARYSEMHM